MKKKLAYLLIGTLSVSMLAGCGKKENKSASKAKDSDKKQEAPAITLKDLIKNMNDAAKGYDSLALKLEANAEGVASAGSVEYGLNGSVKGNLDIDLKSFEFSGDGKVKYSGNLDIDLKSFEFSGDGKVKYSLDLSGNSISGDKSAEFYAEKDGDDLKAYIGMDGDWTSDTITQDDIQNMLEQYTKALDTDTLEENFDKMKDLYTFDSKTEEVNDKDCYVIGLDLNKDQLKDIIKNVDLPEEAGDVDVDSILNVIDQSVKDFSIKMKEYVEVDTYYPVKYELTVSGKGQSGETKVEVDNISISADIDVNKADVKAVPKEAK